MPQFDVMEKSVFKTSDIHMRNSNNFTDRRIK